MGIRITRPHRGDSCLGDAGPAVSSAPKLLKCRTCCQGMSAVVGSNLRAQACPNCLPHARSQCSRPERLLQAAGMDVVRGWAVQHPQPLRGDLSLFLSHIGRSWLSHRYEHLDKGVSEAFVAERFWWNSLPVSNSALPIRVDSIDAVSFSFRMAHGLTSLPGSTSALFATAGAPRPLERPDVPEMLLAEAVDGAPKARAVGARANHSRVRSPVAGQGSAEQSTAIHHAEPACAAFSRCSQSSFVQR